MTRALSLWGPVGLYMALIFYASAQPDLAVPGPFGDKPVHSIVYGGLGVLIVRALAGGLGARVTLATGALGAALTAAYGVTDELHQMFVPGRYADANDLVADAVGGIAGAVVCWLWGILFPARHGL